MTTDPTGTLPDRYVHAALRTVPESQRAELEPDLRELVADRVEARQAAGQDDPERAALVELGDPARLAASYLDRPLQLIGPAHYLQWWRLLKLLLAIVPTVAVIGVAFATAIDGQGVGEIIGEALNVGLDAVVHVAFWTTLVFAVLDRTVDEPMAEWDPDNLREVPSNGRGSRADLVGGTVAQVLLVGLLLWGTFGSPWPWTATEPLLQPGLWPVWVLYFVAIGMLEIAFLVTTFRRGWTWPLAAVNVVLNVAFAIPAVWLATSGRLLNPDVLELAGDSAGDVDGVLTALIASTVVVVTAWDSIDGAIKSSRQERIG